jgi:hypothetical protein
MRSYHQRLSSRVRTPLRVDWCIAGDATHVVSCLDNMSATGAFVRTCVPAPVGCQVDLQLFTGVGPIAARARVVRAEDGGMGIRFAAARR